MDVNHMDEFMGIKGSARCHRYSSSMMDFNFRGSFEFREIVKNALE